jgi:hypothetical protein
MQEHEVRQVCALVVKLFPLLKGETDGLMNFERQIVQYEFGCAETAVRAFHLQATTRRPSLGAIMLAIRAEANARAIARSSFGPQNEDKESTAVKLREWTLEAARCRADNRRWLERVSDADLERLIVAAVESNHFWLSEALSVPAGDGSRRPITAAELRARPSPSMVTQLLQAAAELQQEVAGA